MRSDSAKTLPLTRGKRVRGANAAAVDATTATRNADGAILRTLAKTNRGMLSEKYPRGAIRAHEVDPIY